MSWRSKIRSLDAERAAGALAALFAAVVAVTCAASGELASGARSAPAPAASSAEAPPPASPARSLGLGAPSSSESPAPSAASSGPPAPVPARGLERFHAALAALAAGTRRESVRVLWLGDSHTYADFWTDAVRRPLQARFGNGGPGYLLLGVKPYRHAGVTVVTEGSWRREPSAPSTSARTGDGQFGLAGMRVTPASEGAVAAASPLSGALRGTARWTLYFRAKSAADRLSVRLGDGAPTTLDARAGTAGPSGTPVRRFAVEGEAAARLEVRAVSGAPELFGVALESTAPGVVLDTLGINGARASTPLAWDETAWIAEVRARRPELVVLAYGTNEVAETRPVERYRAHYQALLGRLRLAAPDADCLLAGPTDWDEPSGATRQRVIDIDRVEREVAAELGCRYFSVYDAMGGEGSHTRWERASPALAAPDGIHLMPAGYAKLGELVAGELLPAGR